MPASKAQQRAVHKYTKENYDRFLVSMKPKGRLDKIKAHAQAMGESVNGFINRAIDNQIVQDCGKGPSEAAEAMGAGGAASMYSDEERAKKTSQNDIMAKEES